MSISQDRNGTARLWDAESGAELRALRGQEGAVESVAFSPAGTRVVTASLYGTARLWGSDSGGTCYSRFGAEPKPPCSLVSPARGP